MAKTRTRVRLSTAACPSCGAIGKLRKILYGMPGEDFDFEKYAVGGCVITENDPEYRCSECEWEGFALQVS